MPGYYFHLAACNELANKNRSFELGVEAPDLLKKYYKMLGLEEACKKYNSIRTSEMPDFSYFELRVQQREDINNKDGLHYGISSNPDVIGFWNSLSDDEKKNPFYIGYLWHLLTDLLVYSFIDIDSKLEDFKNKYAKEENFQDLLKAEIKKLHSDWDKTNANIRDFYTNVILPQEIQELGIVKFVNDEETSYLEWNKIKPLIDYMRSFNPTSDNMDFIINDIMSLLNSKDKEKELKKRLM